MSRHAPITLALAATALITMAGPGFAAPKGDLDANGDGKVSLSEFQAGRGERMMAHLDANKDGQLSKDEFAALRDGKPPQGKGGDKLWSRIDLDHDGALSQSERDGFLAQRFARMDLDNDGTLTPTELKSGGGKAKVGI